MSPSNSNILIFYIAFSSVYWKYEARKSRKVSNSTAFFKQYISNLVWVKDDYLKAFKFGSQMFVSDRFLMQNMICLETWVTTKSV